MLWNIIKVTSQLWKCLGTNSQKPRQLKSVNLRQIELYAKMTKQHFFDFFSVLSWTGRWIWLFKMISDLLIKIWNSRRKYFLLHDCELLFLMLKFSIFYISNSNIKWLIYKILILLLISILDLARRKKKKKL